MTVASKPIRTTTKGLITERHGLVFDADATVDELNCDLLVSQIRRRRKGLNYESNYSLSSFTHGTSAVSAQASWENVGGVASLEFLVVQSGDTLYFYDKSSTPISGGIKSFSVDLNSFDAANDRPIASTPFQGDSLDGVFVVVHPGCEAFFIEYDVDTDTISTTQIDPRIRDFDWQGDITGYNINVVTAVATNERIYDTKNAGWDDNSAGGGTPLATMVAAISGYPALTHPWYSGKDSSDVFSATEWLKVGSGNSLTGNGHYILDFFSKNREQYQAGLGNETEASRFATVASFAGRFWYAGLESQKNSGKVLFTKVIQTELDYSRCYQQNDPTSEIASDLLDSDGGEINIPEAYGIKKLFQMGSSLLVFAENGVWRITGVDQVFKATEFSVSKVTGFGIVNAESFVDAGGIPFWWSTTGIHTVTTDQVANSAQETNITRETIQTFWDNIDSDKKLLVKSAYDRENQKIYWMYPSNGETITYKYNRFLVLDLVNRSWVPWEIADQASNTNYIVGVSYFPAYGSIDQTENVTVNGVTVTVNGVDVTWTQGQVITSSDSQIKLICRDGATGSLTIGLFGDTDFVDWGDTDYSSYFTLGYDDFDTLALEKTGLYLMTFLERTEDGWEANAAGDGYEPTNPSGLTVQTFWDFRSTATSDQNVYRLRRFPVPDLANLSTFNYPTSVIINKTGIKGTGRILNMKFNSVSGKEFRFMGYEVIFDRHDQI